MRRLKQVYWRQRQHALRWAAARVEEGARLNGPPPAGLLEQPAGRRGVQPGPWQQQPAQPYRSAARPDARPPGPPPEIQGVRGPVHAVQLSDEQVEGQMNYILVRERSLDEMLLPYGDPAGKDVLVFGGGLGNEVLWSIRRGARSILSVDLTPPAPEPLKRLLAAEGLQHPSWEMRRENIHDTALRGDTYDLIVSNGVFEHVMDLKGVLAAFRRLLRPNGRVAIVADGLWYSSIGGHIQGEPWEHLWNSPEDIKEQHPDRWKAYCDYLNRMTIVDFLEAIRSVGMIVLQLSVRRDQYLHRLPQYLPKIRERLGTVSPTDCSIVSIGCELCFEEQL